ncbi:MAG: hypothetical protein QOH05_1104 [Acetobacteraceae bacterium]|nr:hypothetical protein [Acetobacteraceae bacterium]
MSDRPARIETRGKDPRQIEAGPVCTACPVGGRARTGGLDARQRKVT